MPAQFEDFNGKIPIHNNCPLTYTRNKSWNMALRKEERNYPQNLEPKAELTWVCSLHSQHLGGPKCFTLRILFRVSSTGGNPRHWVEINTNAKVNHLYPRSQRVLTNKMPKKMSCPWAKINIQRNKASWERRSRNNIWQKDMFKRRLQTNNKKWIKMFNEIK